MFNFPTANIHCAPVYDYSCAKASYHMLLIFCCVTQITPKPIRLSMEWCDAASTKVISCNTLFSKNKLSKIRVQNMLAKRHITRIEWYE